MWAGSVGAAITSTDSSHRLNRDRTEPVPVLSAASLRERGLQRNHVVVRGEAFPKKGALGGSEELRQDSEPVVRRGDSELASLGDKLPTEAPAQDPMVAGNGGT